MLSLNVLQTFTFISLSVHISDLHLHPVRDKVVHVQWYLEDVNTTPVGDPGAEEGEGVLRRKPKRSGTRPILLVEEPDVGVPTSKPLLSGRARDYSLSTSRVEHRTSRVSMNEREW